MRFNHVAAGVQIRAKGHRHGWGNIKSCLIFIATRFSKTGLDAAGKNCRIVSRRKEDRQPAIGNLRRQLNILRPNRGEIDRHRWATVQNALEWFT